MSILKHRSIWSNKVARIAIMLVIIILLLGLAPPFGGIFRVLRHYGIPQAVEWLEQNYDYGNIASEFGKVWEESTIPKPRFIDIMEAESVNWNLPAFFMENNVRYVVASPGCPVAKKANTCRSWLYPVFSFYGAVRIYKVDLSPWKRIATMVGGETILSDLPETNTFAGKSVSSWKIEQYGWEKEEFLFEEGISIVVTYDSEDTCADELFADKPDYLTKVAEIDTGSIVSLYRVEAGKLLSRWSDGDQKIRNIYDKAVQSLRDIYDGGNIVCGELYIVQNSSIPRANIVSSWESEEVDGFLPIYLLQNNVRYVVASSSAPVMNARLKYPSLMFPIQTFFGIGIYKVELGEWAGVEELIRGETVLCDLPEINHFAEKSVSSWDAEEYGWEKEEFLLGEGISIVVIYDSENTCADELFADKPGYFIKVAEVNMAYSVSLYRVDMGSVISYSGIGNQTLDEMIKYLKENYNTGNIVCDVDYVMENSAIPRTSFVSPWEAENLDWCLPLFLLENDISYVIVSENSWMIRAWTEYPTLMSPLPSLPGIRMNKTELSEWEEVAELVKGKTVLCDDPRINHFAQSSVSSWDAEKYGWDWETLLAEEEISIAVAYDSEDTCVDKLLAEKPYYLNKIAEVTLGHPVEIYKVDRTMEPLTGAYLGAFVDWWSTTTDEAIQELETTSGKEHAIYIHYMHWGGEDGQSEPEPFPKEWADKVWYDYGAIPLIKWEPNSEPNGYLNDVTPVDPYMIEFAKACGKAGYPIFISFAHEMNGDWHNWNNPSLFIEKWRIVHDVMEQYAPNAIMVWCASIWSANYEDNGRIDDYYPGDDYVDWVGIDMYFPKYKNAEPNSYVGDFPRELIQTLYEIYTQLPHSKPMMIGEWAAAKRCQSNPRLDPNHTEWPDPYTDGEGQWECEDYANERVNNLYPNLEAEFPMIKAVVWFHTWKERDWRVPSAYSTAIADDWFLSCP